MRYFTATLWRVSCCLFVIVNVWRPSEVTCVSVFAADTRRLSEGACRKQQQILDANQLRQVSNTLL